MNTGERAMQALDVIYSTCTPEQRQQLDSEFMTVRQFVHMHTLRNVKMPPATTQSYDYLRDLSDEARGLVTTLVNRGEKNLYHSIMSVIDNYKKRVPAAQQQDVLEYYHQRFANREYVQDDWDIVCEIFDLCWKRHGRK